MALLPFSFRCWYFDQTTAGAYGVSLMLAPACAILPTWVGDWGSGPAGRASRADPAACRRTARAQPGVDRRRPGEPGRRTDRAQRGSGPAVGRDRCLGRQTDAAQRSALRVP